MFRHVRPLAVTNSKRTRFDVLSDTDDHDGVLLPPDGKVPTSVAFFPSKELKYFDKYLENGSIAVPPVWASANMFLNPASGLISTPARGDGPQDRHGRRILLKNLQLSGVVYKAAEPVMFAPPVTMIAYIAVIADTQTRGAQATTGQVFTNDMDDIAALVPPFRNMEFNSRFQVLKHETLALGRGTPFTIDDTVVPAEFSWAGDIQNFNWYLPLDYIVTFNGDSTDNVTSVQDLSLHVVAASTSGGNALKLWYKSRIRFADCSE